MIRVAVLGYGLAGRVFHAPSIVSTPGLELTAISTGSSAELASRDYPHARICTAAEAIRASDIDLVVVATPNGTHAALTLQALSAGKSVVVDKPMATSLAEAHQMTDLAEQRNLKLSVFHNRRWDDDFLTLRKLMTSNRLGTWSGFESRFDRYRPIVPDRWRERPGPGSGLWWDLGPHLVDQALALLGPPDAVTGDLAKQRRGALVPDYLHVILHYGRHRAILHAHCLDPKPAFRFKVWGDSALFMTSGLDPQEAFLNSNRSIPPPARHGVLTTVDGHTEELTLEKGDYTAFYRAMRDSLISDTPVPVPAGAALLTMNILEVAEESARRRTTLSISAPALQ